MTQSVFNSEALNVIISSVAEVAGYIWQKGWAEKNAGNISVNLTGIISINSGDQAMYPHRDLTSSFKILAGEYFFVTGTGKRMRDIAKDPTSNALIIRIDDSGSGYNIITPSDTTMLSSLKPTSELPSHLSIHAMIAARGSNQKVVIHTHANELCALTQSAEFCNGEKLNRILWGMHPETKVFVPAGVGFVPYLLTGSEALALATVKALEEHDVALWEKHGVFAIGENIGDTFDTIDILAKSASIYFTCRAAGITPDGLTDNQIDELGKIVF